MVPRWLHYWAILTVVAALVLLPLGALVTTLHAGMADPIWPTKPWYLIETRWSQLRLDFLIEHSHRLMGWVVGCLAIVLAVGSWRGTPRWVGWLGTSALLAVIAQGLLGGIRVLFDLRAGPQMAAVHGVFGAMVFSLLVCVAVLTGRRSTEPLGPEESRRFGRLGAMVAGLVVVQLGLGSLLRHTYVHWGPRWHLLGAFAVVMAVVWLARAVWDSDTARQRLGRSVGVVVLLVALQVLLGVEAWLSKFSQGMFLESQPVLTLPQVIVRTAHFVLGSCILAATVVTIVLARLAPVATPAEGVSLRPISSSQPRLLAAAAGAARPERTA